MYTLLSIVIAHRRVRPHTLWRFRLKYWSVDERFGTWCRVFGFNCWISFALVFSCMYCWVLMFVLSYFNILICTRYTRRRCIDLSCEPNICVSWSTSELSARLVPLKCLSPPVILTDRSKTVFFFGSFLLFMLQVCLYLYCRQVVCSLQPCDHLLGNGWPLGSFVCDASLCFGHFSIRKPIAALYLDGSSL